MSDIEELVRWVRSADPALGADLDPDGPNARRLFLEACQRSGSVAVSGGPVRDAVPRPPKLIGRRGMVLGAVVALVAVALVVASSVWPGGTSAYAIRQLPNGKIEVDWSANSFRPNADAIAADLRDFGIDVQITTRPASPSSVGVVNESFPMRVEADGPPPGLEYEKDGWTWLIDPTVFDRPLTLIVNVAAAPGERYMYSNSVFMPGEVLAGLQCALGEPLRAADVAARLSDLALTADWIVIDPASVTADSYREYHVSEAPDGVIYSGYAMDDATVQLEVVPRGLSLSDVVPASDPPSGAPCSPELKAAWER
jgi:hypothetical protein